MPVRRISDYINASNRLRPLVTKARRAAGLDQVLLQAVPPSLAHSYRVKEERGGTLVLVAENAAVASKLKQLAPRLLRAYQDLGEKITGIRIEVQVDSASGISSGGHNARGLTSDSIDNLRQLATRLEESPLKAALTKLAGRRKP